MSKNRRYSKYGGRKNPIVYLKTWIQQRCKRCGEFLPLYGHKYCKKCIPVIREEWYKQHPDKRTWEERKLSDKYFMIRTYLYCKVHRNADKYNIGDYI